MSFKTLHFQRRFQVWNYTVGHGQLLLRSTKSSEFPTRIDILFKNVTAIHLPTTFDGVTIAEASDEERNRLKIHKNESEKLFIVRGDAFEGYVIAGTVAHHEDEGEHSDPGFFSETMMLKA